jgi:hypothetical protein
MIKSKEHLEGMVDMLIHLYSQHQRVIDTDKTPYFCIEQKDNVYTVTFQWAVGEKLISHETDYAPADYATDYQTDYFRILKDESLTKLEQYVEDVCDNIVESNINHL